MRTNTQISMLLALIALPFSARASAPPPSSSTADIAAVSLISTASYDPRLEQGRAFTAFFSDLGTMMKGPGTDLSQTVLDKLNNPALRAYFPDPAERARLARSLANDTKRRYLARGYSNQSVDAALKYLTDQLVNAIVVKVLQQEGVTDVRRAGVWATKILAPFDRCMGRAISYVEADKCTQPLESDLVKNVGLALAYELPRQEFGKGAADTAAYVKCLRPSAAGADNRVRDCALDGVRAAASTFGRSRVLAVANQQVASATAGQITNQVMPAFDSCLKGAQNRAGFLACGDQLITSAGTSITESTILSDPRVGKAIPQASDREALATAGSAQFRSCLADNQKNGLRDPSGMLQTGNCQNFVTLETSRAVAGALLESTINQNLPAKATDAERAAAVKATKDQLNACWDSKQPEASAAGCLRTVVKQTALNLASARLQASAPPGTDAAVIRQVLSHFGACLDGKMPADPIKQDGATAASASCASAAFREAATSVAEARVRKALQGEVSDPAKVDGIVNTLVKQDFPNCLGDNPGDDTIASCSLKLEKNVAWQASELLIPSRVDAFFQAGGGAAGYGLDDAGQQNLVSGVLADQKQCLKTHVKGSDQGALDGQVNDCFKGAIRDLAVKLGALQLQKSAKANGLDPSTPAFQQTAQGFQNDLGTCLDQKKDPRFSLGDYLKNLADCQASLARSTTANLAKAQLHAVVKDLVADGAAIEQGLDSAFDTCMASATDSGDACVGSLKEGATVSLAEAAVHQQAIALLSTPERPIKAVPAEIAAVDDKLAACVKAKKKSAGDCSVDYVKTASKTIGHLSLVNTVKPAYSDAQWARLTPDLAATEAPFQACVDQAPATMDKKMMAAITACGENLQGDVESFLLFHPADPGTADPAVAPAIAVPTHLAADDLSDMMARTVLCLNGSLDPSDAQALRNLEPASVEDKLLKLIGSYVSYDLKKAEGDFADALGAVAGELKAAGPDSARRKLLGLLVDKGMTDQLLKANVQKALAKAAVAAKLSPELSARLSANATIDSVLQGDALTKLRPLLADGVLQPVLVDGKALDSSSVLRALRDVRSQAVDAVLASPSLGLDDAAKAAVKAAIQ